MKKLFFLLVVAALLSSCESKSGHRVPEKPVNASVILTTTDVKPVVPQSISLETMSAFKTVGVAKIYDDWNVGVVKLYQVPDSAIYSWSSDEAKFLFVSFK